MFLLLSSTGKKNVAYKRFENLTELIINAEDGGVNCNAKNGSRVYWCDIKFDLETIDTVLKIIGHVSETIGDNGIDFPKTNPSDILYSDERKFVQT